MIDWRQHLTSDPRVCYGQLCAKGTRVLVTNILDSLSEGASQEEVMRSYPSLKPEHIDAAIAYAAVDVTQYLRYIPQRSSHREGGAW